jgi:hypothetical protein
MALLRWSRVQGVPWLRWPRTSVNQEGIDGCSSRKADASTATAERTLPMALGGRRASINEGVMVQKASLKLSLMDAALGVPEQGRT